MLQPLPIPYPMISAAPGSNIQSASNITLDNNGESRSLSGPIRIVGGGTKTLSAAGGGKIWWRTSGSTFSDAGTEIRVGLQDTQSNGREDGTFDVYGSLVGGTDSIPVNSQQATTMTSGTKTLADGDIASIVIEMVTRGGSDSVAVAGVNAYPAGSAAPQGALYPFGANDTGGGPTNAINTMLVIIQFDDGTFGYVDGLMGLLPAFSSVAEQSQSYSDSSNPDEYAAAFQVPFRCKVSGLSFFVNSLNFNENFDVKLYSDPFGAPSAIMTKSVNPVASGINNGSRSPYHALISEITLEPGTWYAASLRATSTNAFSFAYIDLGSGNAAMKTLLPFGSNVKFVARNADSGAFSEVDSTYVPRFGILISALDDGGPTKEEIAAAVWAYEPRTLTA